ncbi:hypothetical protein FB567DRAFT_116693 [Paraphoma chrysanthemicola]|uniref:NYN domain-containing protein n=1 Tax=Paraphoma chrysanthemicola TaxID=798071 RepID=A0A8K0R2T0_9PLEO|nr:hypothetical protein FB567DRAFT_116693 [Paraphoma chrysanthemicola]
MSASLKVHIYIDNSNLFIQGGKTYSSDSSQAPVSDLSWRYDISLLIDVLTSYSSLDFDSSTNVAVDTDLYGSTPPPTDIWAAFGKPNIKVHTFSRSTWTGKEKQVDTRMVADMTKQAVKDEMTGVKSEFIVVTGDEDLLPAVENINESAFRAHVWSWKMSFSKAFQPQFDTNGRQVLYVYELDKYKDKITYRKTEVRPCDWGLYCHRNVECRLFHSPEDLRYFISHGGNKQLRKYAACHYGGCCTNRV